MLKLIVKIQEIIEAYHGSNEIMENEIEVLVKAWGNQINAYKSDYIKEQIREGVKTTLESSKNLNKVYNQKIINLIDETKKKVLPNLIGKKERAADHAAQVNNALQLLRTEEDDLEDEIAFMYLKDFEDDVEQMRIFKRFIAKKVEMVDALGNTTFPKTFGKLNEVELILNTINELESIANMLFIHPKSDGQTLIVNGQGYSIPVDGYEQMEDEANIIGFAEILEEYVNTIPEINDIADKANEMKEPIVEGGTGE